MKTNTPPVSATTPRGQNIGCRRWIGLPLALAVLFSSSLFSSGAFSSSTFSTDPPYTGKDWNFLHIDTFDGANPGIDYGLNDRLDERRLYLPANGNWVRRAGAWYDKPVIREWWSQVNHPWSGPNQLSFHVEHSAVMLNAPLQAGVDGGYRIAVTTNPILGSDSDGEWTSVMLNGSNTKRGWVADSDFGLLIRSDGSLALFQNGEQIRLNVGAVPAASEYRLDLTVKSGSLHGTINDTHIGASLGTIPDTVYAYLGAYIEPGSGKVSTFDDFEVRVATSTVKRVQYMGYYWADSTPFGAHIPEVAAHSNFNFVDGIDRVDAAKRAGKSCIVQIRWEFFNKGPMLRPDWETQWQATFSQIRKKQQYIAALYHVDEPFLDNESGANVDLGALQTAVNRVKADLATIPAAGIQQMAVFSYVELERPDLQAKVAALRNLDLVGFDHYVSVNAFFAEIPAKIATLKTLQPGKPIVLVPQSFFVGTTTDADIARINWLYYRQALLDDSVIGMKFFGMWSTPGVMPHQIPIAFKAQQRIGRAILED
jgi:hypothetical protein